MKYVFHTTCQSTSLCGEHGEAITEMTQSPHNVDIDSDVFLRVFAEKSGIKDELLEAFGKSSDKEFSEDWGISCHKSYFQGVECLYVRFSGIEHIYVDSERVNQLPVTAEEVDQRFEKISELEEMLDEVPAWLNAETQAEHFHALKAFAQEHAAEFEEHNILLGSLFAYQNPYQDIARKIDQSVFSIDSTPTGIEP